MSFSKFFLQHAVLNKILSRLLGSLTWSVKMTKQVYLVLCQIMIVFMWVKCYSYYI